MATFLTTPPTTPISAVGAEQSVDAALAAGMSLDLYATPAVALRRLRQRRLPVSNENFSTTGHVLEISEATFDRLLRETSELAPAGPRDLDGFDIGASGNTGTHPVYGMIALSRVDQPAAHPTRPSFSMIIMAEDNDPRVAKARAELEIPAR